MNNPEKQKVTWLTAFKVLSRGKSPAIGKYPRLKSMTLNFAMLELIALVLVGVPQVAIMSGKTPPNVPLIRETGAFVQVTQGQASYVAFVGDSGRTYKMERGTTIRYDADLPHGNPPPHVYAEGFLRGNGHGYFWPTLIRLPGGKLLLTPQRSMVEFHNSVRSVYKTTLLFSAVDAILWCFSISCILKIKRNLMKGN